MIRPALTSDMLAKGIDIGLTELILEDLNAGLYDSSTTVEALGVPLVDGKTIVETRGSIQFELPESIARDRLTALEIELPAGIKIMNGIACFDQHVLEDLGERLYEVTAWGVLNGGSATSYADIKKNSSLGPGIFDAIKRGFELLAPLCEGKPKGITPAYINPDGSPGESFLVLKMRAALIKAMRFAERFGNSRRPVLPFFQMTSDGTDAALAEAYSGYRKHPWLVPYLVPGGMDPTMPRSAKQPLIAAFSHSSEGRPKKIFDAAWAKSDSSLALPGGHGQSFRVLEQVYRSLLSDGYRYAWLGNVDNIGYIPDPAELAVMALSGAEASFEFSYRTPVDIKGGILVTTRNGRKTVADIGQAISFETVKALESSGKKVLFNCATCILDLERIVPRLKDIARKLPVRVSDQDKDAGRYSQAEQSTWEVIGLLDEPLGFAVEKGKRFIAAKLLAETILASSAGDDSSAGKLPAEVMATAQIMSQGLSDVLSGSCDLRLEKGRWIPR